MPREKRSSSSGNFGGLMKKVVVVILVVLPLAMAPLLVRLFVKGDDAMSSKAPVKRGLAEVPGSVDAAKVKTQELETADLTQIEDASSEIKGEWRGVCQKNSIHSVEDFQKTVQNDPVLLSHFSGFNWETAKIGKQDEETFAYVSHRKDSVIKQTAKPIRLPKGDGYITDGVRFARTYCCNDINMTPSAGAPKKEPPPVTMTPSAGAPEESAPSEPFPPSDPLGVAPFRADPSMRFSPTEHPSNVSSSNVVPEPASLLLMGTGLIVLVAACRKRKP